MKTIGVTLSGRQILVYFTPNTKSMRLIHNEYVTIVEEYNIRRHHVEKHQTFQTNFPEESHERDAKVQSSTASYD